MEPYEIWNALLKKPRHLMSEHERNVNLANVFLVDFEMGGWLYNLAPSSADAPGAWIKLRETAAALRAVGSEAIARSLEEIAALLEQAPTVTVADASWDNVLATADPGGRIKVLEKQIGTQVNDAYVRLEAYTLDHCAK